MHDIGADDSTSFDDPDFAWFNDCAPAIKSTPPIEVLACRTVTLSDDAVHLFRPAAIAIDIEKLLRIQGYKDLNKVRPALHRAIYDVLAVAIAVLQPKIYYRKVSISKCGPDSVVLATGHEFRSRAFQKYLSGCSDIVAFVVTMGRAFDTVEERFVKNGKLLEQLIFESMGWIGIEDATAAFSQRLTTTAALRALTPTRRISPGYSFRVGEEKVDWPLDQQSTLFKLFDGAAIEVELLPSCAMTPKMSRSSILGLLPSSLDASRPEHTKRNLQRADQSNE